MLEYLKDWRIWLICAIIVVIIENPITAFGFEKPKSIDWTPYAETVLRLERQFDNLQPRVRLDLWNVEDENPYAKAGIKQMKRPKFSYKGFCFKWQKLNTVETRYEITNNWDFRMNTKFNVNKLAPEHSFKTFINAGKGIEFVAGAKFDESFKPSPDLTFTLRW